MSSAVNEVGPMYSLRGRAIDKFGLDQTGRITYQFNNQGWRNHKDYDFVPAYVFFGCSSVFGIGVEQKQIFSSMFVDHFNCGLAGQYTNHDIAMSILNFVHSSGFFDHKVKMAVIWTDRNPELLYDCYSKVKNLDLRHFFCGRSIEDKHCWPMIAAQDTDASGTHMGPATHHQFYKVLCAIFGL